MDNQDGIKKRRKQKEKEDLVTQSGKATDNLASISRQLAETVERWVRVPGELLVYFWLLQFNSNTRVHPYQ